MEIDVKTRLTLIGVIGVLVITTFGLLAVTLLMKGNVLYAAPAIICAVVLAVFGGKRLKDEYDRVKKGFPVEDERSAKVRTNAMAWAFLAGIWWLLALGWYDNLATDAYGLSPFRDPSQATGMGILGMAIFFGIFWIYFNWKGDLK